MYGHLERRKKDNGVIPRSTVEKKEVKGVLFSTYASISDEGVFDLSYIYPNMLYFFVLL